RRNGRRARGCRGGLPGPRRACDPSFLPASSLHQLILPLRDDPPRIIRLLPPVHILCQIAQRDDREMPLVEIRHVLLEPLTRRVYPRVLAIGRSVKLEDRDFSVNRLTRRAL